VPAFFNAHCHAAMTLTRGWAEDLPFERWLNERIWVAESALTEDDVYWGASLAACEMIRTGTVGFADHYFYMDRVAQVVAQSGMKALLAWCYFGLGPEKEVGGISLLTTEEFVESWQGDADGRIRTCFGPHSPYMCSPETLKHVVAAAERLGAGIHLHLSESGEQVQASLKAHGRTPVGHVAALGLFTVPTLAAHCNCVTDDDVEILARHRVSVAHAPKTYLKLAMDMPPVERLLAHDVRVALATDGPASNADLNLLEVMRLTRRESWPRPRRCPSRSCSGWHRATAPMRWASPRAGRSRPGPPPTSPSSTPAARTGARGTTSPPPWSTPRTLPTCAT
jgi:5-methylthioadenosine/S-adenosylhomocysteine deaminase